VLVQLWLCLAAVGCLANHACYHLRCLTAEGRERRMTEAEEEVTVS
jgi:hypothetical protein